MAASSSSGIVERQYNYGGLIVRTFVHSAKSSSPPALGAEDSQSPPLDSSISNNQMTSPVKRGRGRPRKNPKPNSTADDDDAASDQSSQPASTSLQKPPKKKRRQLAGAVSGSSRVPAYISLLTEEEMTAVRKRNRRGKQWIPGEKTVMNELARLGRSVPDPTGTQQLQNEEDSVEDDDPEAEFGLTEGIEPADDDVIDCDPFTGLDDMHLDSTGNAGAVEDATSSSAHEWVRVNNEQTQFQQQTEGNGESSFDYYMCPPSGASTLEPPSAALDKDSSFVEQLNSTVPELSEPLLQPSDPATTLSHPTPPPSSLSPQNPPPKRPSAPPPPPIHVDTTAALGVKLTELIAASHAFIPTPVHCSFSLPLPEGEFAQKQYATDLVSAISDVDRYVYVTKNSTWNSTNSGSRGAIFVCNMSLESLKKRKTGTGEDQKKVSMARTRYPCEGCITIRFLAKKNVISVIYKHHAIHRSPYDKIEDSETVPENNATTTTASSSTKDAPSPLEKPPTEEIIVPALAQIPSIARPG
ncbi:hypothetical protein L873DRAFT_1785781 [Choiromyces venosus 120613-1]|uniref:Uncharacterized protein n=1 Tax=Choiromyces venosus 120613-1 TaxID=1336337 RepID=A0A3N4K425_9PEZI|nr:hypothetical protein L873DRAFT_1785781 [Choiromyces venosus 120613-1]